MMRDATTPDPRSPVRWLALLAATVASWLPIVALYRVVAAPVPGR